MNSISDKYKVYQGQETDSPSGVICPYCGHEHEEVGDIFEFRGFKEEQLTYECVDCEKPFHCGTQIRINFWASPISVHSLRDEEAREVFSKMSEGFKEDCPSVDDLLFVLLDGTWATFTFRDQNGAWRDMRAPYANAR